MSKQLKINNLIPDSENFNTGNEFGEALIEKSFSKFGAGRSILIDKNSRVIAGNKSLQKFVEGGGQNVIVVETTGNDIVAVKRTDIDLNTTRGREMALADNATAKANILWDVEKLAKWEMPTDDWGVYFDEPEPELVEDEAAASEAINKAAELQKKWQTASGQLWKLGEHRLVCGDCTKAEDVARVMGGEKVDAVLTDPPYGQSQDGVPNDDPEGHRSLMLDAVAQLPIENGVIVAFQSPRLFVNWLDALRAHQYQFERMLWMYKAAQCTFPWRGWILTSESILVATKGEGQWQEVHPFAHDCYYLSEVSGELEKDSGWHGSVKPIKVVSDLLSRICPQGSIVYEPFLGSGTTLIACEQLNRKCRAIEIAPEYVAVALERWHQLTGLMPELIETAEAAKTAT